MHDYYCRHSKYTSRCNLSNEVFDSYILISMECFTVKSLVGTDERNRMYIFGGILQVSWLCGLVMVCSLIKYRLSRR